MLDLTRQQAWPSEPLQAILLAAIRDAERAMINDAFYLQTFGFPHANPCTAGDLWRYLLEATQMMTDSSPWATPLRTILRYGPLARRLLHAVREEPSRQRVHAVYRELCTCLASNTMFTGSDWHTPA